MAHKSRQNVPVMVNGKEEWISRSIVAIAFVFRVCKGKLYFLTELRGPAVSHTGEYCGPCGFLDYDENLNEACSREVFEETGLEIEPNKFRFIDINSNPEGVAQNVGVRFCNFEKCDELPELNLDKITTKDEVTQLMWTEVGDVYEDVLPLSRHRLAASVHYIINMNHYKLGQLKWAFDHDKIMIHMLDKTPSVTINN